MVRQKKAAPKDSIESINTKTEHNHSNANKPPYKVELALNALLHKGPQGITQPEAFMIYRESCLHTTISSLKNGKGICFISQPDYETIAHFHQKPFSRYWLASNTDREKALKLLNAYRSNRGLEKLNYEAWHTSTGKAA